MLRPCCGGGGLRLSTTMRSMTRALELADEHLPERCEVLALLTGDNWTGALIRYSDGMLRGLLDGGRWIGVEQEEMYLKLAQSSRTAGKPKNFSPEEIQARRERLARGREEKRWPKAGENNDPRR